MFTTNLTARITCTILPAYIAVLIRYTEQVKLLRGLIDAVVDVSGLSHQHLKRLVVFAMLGVWRTKSLCIW